MTQHDNQFANRFVVSGIDRMLTVQRPAVLAHLHSIRSRHPEASPEEVIRVLEKRYLAAVTTRGALVASSQTAQPTSSAAASARAAVAHPSRAARRCRA